MDNYEYKLKTEQIEKLIKKKDYITAAKIADGIDWRGRKIETATLSMVADLYDAAGRPEECYEILQLLCDRLKTRRILYRMVEVSLKMREFDRAKELYEEFVSIAPKDLSRYLLKYRIYRAMGKPLEYQIEVLEQYRAQEYVEEWAYELAGLYEEAGLIKQCIEECDELILWFNEGEYVIKALEMKMRHCDLTAAEKQKYELRFEMLTKEDPDDDISEEETEMTDAETEDVSAGTAVEIAEAEESPLTADEKETSEKAADEPAEDDTPQVQEVNLHKFSTINLQEELAASMRELFDEQMKDDGQSEQTTKDTEADVEDDIAEKAITQEFVPIRENVWRGEKAEEELAEEAESEKIKETESEPVEETESEPAKDVGAETEKEKQEEAAEAVEEVKEAGPQGELQLELRKYAADAQTVQEEPQYVVEEDGQLCLLVEEENLADKQITGQLTIGEILEAWEERKRQEQAKTESERKAAVLCETGEITGMLGDFIPTTPKEEKTVELPKEDENEAEYAESYTEEMPEEELEDDLPQDIDLQEEEVSEYEQQEQEEEVTEPEQQEQEEVSEPEQQDQEEVTEPVQQEQEPEAVVLQAEDTMEAEKDANHPVKQETAGSTLIGENTASMLDAIERALALEIAPLEVGGQYLTEEQEKIFAYFTSVRGMKRQLLDLLQEERAREKAEDSASGNLLITGHPGNGKTTLAIDIVKALQKQRGVKGAKIAKVTGAGLNKKDPAAVMQKVGAGALIVERAGGMDDATIEKLSEAMEGITGGLLVILEDSAEEIENIMAGHADFAAKFTRSVNIPIFSNDELVTFGKSYAEEQEYYFEDMAVLALYDSIGTRQTAQHVVNITEVKEIIDQAIARAQKRSKGIFARFSRRRVNEDGNRLLLEEDFQD